MRLPEDLFRTIVEHAPLISVDLLVRDGDRHLLGLRRNRPAQDAWFVPGGRIYKGETIRAAIVRIAREELGHGAEAEAPLFRGVYEHFYTDSVFGGTPSTHYIALAYELRCAPALANLPEAQHRTYRWFDREALLADPHVHAHTKAYFAG